MTKDKPATRDELVASAEALIARTGCYYDRESEVEDYLFGYRGFLQEHDDPQLRRQMLTLWRGHRSTGAKLEREQEEHLAAWGERARRREEQARPPRADLAEVLHLRIVQPL